MASKNMKPISEHDDWWFTHSPLGVTSDNGKHEGQEQNHLMNTLKNVNTYIFTIVGQWWLVIHTFPARRH